MKWVTESKFVDNDTGDILDERLIKIGKYLVVKKNKTSKVNNKHYGTTTITNICEKSRQRELFE